MVKCYLYMIECKNNALYTGVSNDFLNRWLQHFKGQGARYIRNNGFRKPVFLQEFESKSAAMKEESFIKGQDKFWKRELVLSKLNLLNNNPQIPLETWQERGKKGKLPWT